MRDGVTQGGDGDVSPLSHEDVQHGVQHVVEQHEEVGENGQDPETRTSRWTQGQV